MPRHWGARLSGTDRSAGEGHRRAGGPGWRGGRALGVLRERAPQEPPPLLFWGSGWAQRGDLQAWGTPSPPTLAVNFMKCRWWELPAWPQRPWEGRQGRMEPVGWNSRCPHSGRQTPVCGGWREVASAGLLQWLLSTGPALRDGHCWQAWPCHPKDLPEPPLWTVWPVSLSPLAPALQSQGAPAWTHPSGAEWIQGGHLRRAYGLLLTPELSSGRPLSGDGWPNAHL